MLKAPTAALCALLAVACSSEDTQRGTLDDAGGQAGSLAAGAPATGGVEHGSDGSGQAGTAGTEPSTGGASGAGWTAGSAGERSAAGGSAAGIGGADMAGEGGSSGGASGGSGGTVEPGPRCVGTASPCESLSTADCGGYCLPGERCGGATSLDGSAVLNCVVLGTEADCLAFEGCVWAGLSCQGVPKACTLYRVGPPNNEDAACEAQPGCRLVVCSGAAPNCSDIPIEECSLQPGCSVDPG